MKYDWKRFWCPREQTYLVTDEGYLSDPEKEHVMRISPHARTLDRYAHHPCIVLLGEPGLGKSTEFDQEFERQRHLCAATGDACLRFNLNEYQTDALLVADVFEGPDQSQWRDGTRNLYLFLDSLDEGRLNVKTIANLLAGRLRRLGSHADRLKMRIACRVAEWPLSLESALSELWPSEDIKFLELAPLRFLDVSKAVSAEQLDRDRFFSEVARLDAHSFAIRPISLKFLLQSFKRNGSLPHSKLDLYRFGCEMLCEEFNPNRRENPPADRLRPLERLVIAGRVASLIEYCGKGAVSFAPEAELEIGDVSVSQIAGGFESLENKRFEVTESAVREVLETTLFNGRGARRVGFAHKTYSEFLAAYYVHLRRLDTTQIRSLLFHATEDASVVPQLSEVAAWSAMLNPEIFEQIFSGDPLILLKSDVPTDEHLRFRLIDRMLKGFRDKELDDSDQKLRRHYPKLRHGGILEQLGSIISDKRQSNLTRRFISDFAEVSQAVELLDLLIAIALDDSDDINARVQAARAITHIGGVSHITALRPLIGLKRATDPFDELFGVVLSGLREFKLVFGQQLFDLLRKPRRSFSGIYRNFLQKELPESLSIEDIESGLQWCAKQRRPSPGYDSRFNIEQRLVELALQNLHEQDIRREFAAYCVSRLNRGETIPRQQSFESLNEEDRRKLVEAILLRISESEVGSIQSLRLIQPKDLNWLLNQSCVCTTERKKYAKLVRVYYQLGNVILDVVISECELNDVLRREFSSLLEPVELASEKADEMRRDFKEVADYLQEKFYEPPEINLEPYLQRCEQGDLSAWWQLIGQMKFSSNGYESDLLFVDDLTEFPGWRSASPHTQTRIISAAKRYLLKWKSNPRLYRSTAAYKPDMAGYRAFVLLQKECRDFVKTLDHTFWNILAPTAVAFQATTGMESDGEIRQRSIIARCYKESPQRVIKAILTLVNDADEYGYVLSALARIEECLDRKLALVLLDKARDRSLRPTSTAELITIAFRECPAEAEALARARLIGSVARLRSRYGGTDTRSLGPRIGAHGRVKRSRPGVGNRSTEKKWLLELSLNFICVLWKNGASRWETLWPILRRDVDLFRLAVQFLSIEDRELHVTLGSLTESNLGDLYLGLCRAFPLNGDPITDGSHYVDFQESAVRFTEEVLRTLQAKGSKAAVSELLRIEAVFPNLEYLARARRKARSLMLEITWTPPAIEDLKSLLLKTGRRLIRTEADLATVVIESLDRLQKQISGETSSCRDLWDFDRLTNSWAPIDENDFANYLKRYLDNCLSARAIIALREVEVKRGYDGASGERTDIYVVVAISRDGTPDYDLYRVIVEVKGCWHRELKTALNEQLKDRYLSGSSYGTGIYVVGWYLCDTWRRDDYRRAQSPKWTFEEARAFFEKQASQASTDLIDVRAFVLDARLT